MKKASTFLLLLLLATPLLAATPDRRVANWHSDIEKTKEWLREGKYKKADRLISGTVGEVCNALTGGDEAARMFGMLLTLRALAEAGTGQEQEALWSWQIAQQFEPMLSNTNLLEFGSPGQLLAENIFDAPEESASDQSLEPTEGSLPAEEVEDSEKVEDEVTPPKVVKGPVKFPRGASWSRQNGTVRVMVLIEENGEVSDPRILETLPNPALTLTAIEAMKTWSFQPALLNGEPTPAYYNLKVNYIVQ